MHTTGVGSISRAVSGRRWGVLLPAWPALLAVVIGSAYEGGTAVAAPLRTGLDGGGHLSGNHRHPGPDGPARERESERPQRSQWGGLQDWSAPHGPASGPHAGGPFSARHREPCRTDGEFVKQVGPRLKLGGDEFRFAGTNNYYLPYKSEFMVDDVLGRAADQGFTVVRTWAFTDIGNQDGSNSTDKKADVVVYFHYFDGAKPAFNDGPDGLQHLDYVLKRAGELCLRVVLPLTNNWREYGGMD